MLSEPTAADDHSREIDRIEYLLRADGADNEYAIMLARAASQLSDQSLLDDLTVALLADAIPIKR